MQLGDTFSGSMWTLSDLIPTQTGLDNEPDQNDSTLMGNLGNLAILLTTLYNQIGPFSINSAYRSDTVNQAVGGAPGSYHHLGIAADIIPTRQGLREWFSNLYNSGLGSQLGEIYIKPTQGSIHLSLSTPEKTAWWGILDPATHEYRTLDSAEEAYFAGYSTNPGEAVPSSLHYPGAVTELAQKAGSLILGNEGNTDPTAMGFALLGIAVLSAVLVTGFAVKKKPSPRKIPAQVTL